MCLCVLYKAYFYGKSPFLHKARSLISLKQLLSDSYHMSTYAVIKLVFICTHSLTYSPTHPPAYPPACPSHLLTFMDKSSAGTRQAKANTLSRTPHTTIIITVRMKLSAALLSSLKLIWEEDPGWVITTTFSCGKREEGREGGGRRSAYPHFCSWSASMILNDPNGCCCQPGPGMACCIPSGIPTQWQPWENDLRLVCVCFCSCSCSDSIGFHKLNHM